MHLSGDEALHHACHNALHIKGHGPLVLTGFAIDCVSSVSVAAHAGKVDAGSGRLFCTRDGRQLRAQRVGGAV